MCTVYRRPSSRLLHCYIIPTRRFAPRPIPQIPLAESLKDTRARTAVFWDETVVPSLKEGKTILIVGHENNLRSMIMRLENIDPKDVINLSLPRAVPLAYKLDADLKPIPRPDGKLDEATGFLNGVWLGGDDAVKKVLEVRSCEERML